MTKELSTIERERQIRRHINALDELGYPTLLDVSDFTVTEERDPIGDVSKISKIIRQLAKNILNHEVFAEALQERVGGRIFVASSGAIGSHAFVNVWGRFYDSDTPHGVISPYHLPFFKRNGVGVNRFHYKPDPEAVKDASKGPWDGATDPTIAQSIEYAKANELEPPDIKRCQAEVHTYNAFRIGGSPTQVERCKKRPIYVVTECKPREKGGPRGSMSLCGDCYTKFVQKLGLGYATLRTITKEDRREKGI